MSRDPLLGQGLTELSLLRNRAAKPTRIQGGIYLRNGDNLSPVRPVLGPRDPQDSVDLVRDGLCRVALVVPLDQFPADVLEDLIRYTHEQIAHRVKVASYLTRRGEPLPADSVSTEPLDKGVHLPAPEFVLSVDPDGVGGLAPLLPWEHDPAGYPGQPADQGSQDESGEGSF
jgi:hypothetical protein